MPFWYSTTYINESIICALFSIWPLEVCPGKAVPEVADWDDICDLYDAHLCFSNNEHIPFSGRDSSAMVCEMDDWLRRSDCDNIDNAKMLSVDSEDCIWRKVRTAQQAAVL